MLICPHCGADIPEGMQFCLQCGGSLAALAEQIPAEPAAVEPPSVSPVVEVEEAPELAVPPGHVSYEEPPPLIEEEPPPIEIQEEGPTPIEEGEPPPKRRPITTLSTVSLKISRSPLIAPREEAPPVRRRIRREDSGEVDEESIKRAFEKPPPQPGIIVCRFCKAPLDLEGDFCEQCGAPLSEAAPPGILKPQPHPPALASAPPPPPAPPARPSAPPAPPAPPPPAAVKPATPAPPPHPAPPSPVPVVPVEPASPLPRIVPIPAAAPLPPDAPSAAPPTPEESDPGLMARLKGIFKKS